MEFVFFFWRFYNCHSYKVYLFLSKLGNCCRVLRHLNIIFHFYRVPDPLLTRKERVSLCFSSTVLMYLIIMATYSIPSFDESDTIDPYTFGFHHRLIWTPIVGSITAFLIHLPLVYFIRRGHISSLKGKRLHKLIKVNTGVMATICW